MNLMPICYSCSHSNRKITPQWLVIYSSHVRAYWICDNDFKRQLGDALYKNSVNVLYRKPIILLSLDDFMHDQFLFDIVCGDIEIQNRIDITTIL